MLVAVQSCIRHRHFSVSIPTLFNPDFPANSSSLSLSQDYAIFHSNVSIFKPTLTLSLLLCAHRSHNLEKTEMASGERISEKLKLIDSKRNSLRDVILTLATEWKDLDDELDSTQKCVQATLDELRVREDNLELVLESVRQSNKELEMIWESVESRVEELEMREKGLLSFQQTQIEELKFKQKQLHTMRMSADERITEAELREERVNEQHKSLEGLLEKLESEKEQLEHIQKSIGQRFKDIVLKETYLEGRSRELNSIQNWIERRAKELDTKEEQVDDRVNELELEEELIRKLNEERCKELELKEREICSVQKLNEEQSAELDSKEKQLDAVQKYINQAFKDFHSQNKQLKLDQKLYKKRSMELESKEKQLEERCREVEVKQKQFVSSSVHSRVKVEQLEDMMPVDAAEIQFVVTMDGRNLQLFLNERSLDDESMASEVYRALRLSLDPAKLVLDAMEGFYPPHLKKGGVESEEDVVRKSCIVLLEQLMKISPLIRPCVKEGALKLAEEWKAKMRAVPYNYLELLGFLQLLASYKLASGFDTDELFKLLAVVAEHNQAPDLYRVLGFTEKVPDLIENFVKENQELVAVKLSFGFGLCDKFPPVPLLKRYLKRVQKVSKKRSNMREESSEAQDRVIDERVASIRALIKCIVDHNLESQFSCKSLEQSIVHFLKDKGSNRRIRARLIKAQAPAYKANRVMSSTIAPVHLRASASKLDRTTHTMACILANMDGKNLQLFLNEHLEEHEWIHNEIYDALQMSSDSGKLVLDAIQGFYPPQSKKGGIDIEAGVIRKSCIFLLEISMRFSQKMKPQVKEAAMKLAVDWKTKAVVDTKKPLAILGFLLLVGTYGLAPAFNADELRKLFQTVAENRLAPQLSQALGFSEKVPVNDLLHFQEKINQSASENLQLNSIIPSSSLGPSHSMQGAVPPCIQFSTDPAKLVLDSMLGCYHSTFKANALKAFNLLLSQLLGVPLEIKTHVKEEAMKFASEWKDKVKQRSPLEVWCFLLFLATYKGASCFDTNELLDLLVIVCYRRQATNLFSALGLADEASNFIRRLIQRALYLDAIYFIYRFSLVDEFPPTPLLERYSSCAEEAAKNIRKEERKSLRAQYKAIKKEVAALNMVIKFIELHGLESRYARIEQLLRQQRSVAPAPAVNGQPPKEVDKRSAMHSLALLAQPQEQDGRKRFAPILDHDSKTQPQQRSAKKICLDPVITACPIWPPQQPYQHPPGVCDAETARYPDTPYAQYSLGASTPVPATHMSNKWSEYESLGGVGDDVSHLSRNALSRDSNEELNKNSYDGKPYPPTGSCSSIGQQTFWTSCPFCAMRHQYYREYLNGTLLCQKCAKPFTACDLGAQGVPLGSNFVQPPFPQQKPTQYQGSYNVGSEKNTGSFLPSHKGSQGNFSNRTVVSKPVSKTGSPAEVGGGSTTKVKEDGLANNEGGKKGVGSTEVDAVKPRESVTSTTTNRKTRRKLVLESSGSSDAAAIADMEEVDAVKPRESVTSTTTNRKRRRKLVLESSESSDAATIADTEEVIISFNESFGGGDDVSPPRGNALSGDNKEELKKGSFNIGVSRMDKTTGFVAVDRDKEGINQRRVNAEGSLPNGSSEVSGEAAVMGDCDAGTSGVKGNDSQSDSDSSCVPDPVFYECPDPEFNDFDKGREENCFSVDQLWACYDTTDGMPRFYARIRKVFLPGFRLRITWLEPHLEDQDELNWFNGDLPVACGKFIHGDTEETIDRLMFSHQVHFDEGSGRCSYVIYPRKGETWALFKDWDINWSFGPKNHKKYQFEIVEVLSDFVRDDGIRVAYLDKVESFVSVFQLNSREGMFSFLIPPTELLRFSHRVPSFKLVGMEREGIPEGSFELDPASLATIFDVPSDVKMQVEGLCKDP